MLAAIVTRDHRLVVVLPSDTPPSARSDSCGRCLERDGRKRLADAGEARFQMEEALAARRLRPGAATARATAAAHASSSWAIAAMLLIALVIALLAT